MHLCRVPVPAPPRWRAVSMAGPARGRVHRQAGGERPGRGAAAQRDPPPAAAALRHAPDPRPGARTPLAPQAVRRVLPPARPAVPRVVARRLCAGNAGDSPRPKGERVPCSPRRYRLSRTGLASLRASIARTQPWLLTRGPATPAGKARSSRNSWKHGARSARSIQAQKSDAEWMRLLRAFHARVDSSESERVLSKQMLSFHQIDPTTLTPLRQGSLRNCRVKISAGASLTALSRLPRWCLRGCKKGRPNEGPAR